MWLTDDDSKLAWFNPASLEAAEQYTLIGVVVGLAVYHASTLDIPLPGAAFKRLLNKPVTIDDLAEWQPALARGLRDMLTFQGDVEETYCRTFVGEVSALDLVGRQRKRSGADVSLSVGWSVRILRRNCQRAACAWRSRHPRDRSESRRSVLPSALNSAPLEFLTPPVAFSQTT